MSAVHGYVGAKVAFVGCFVGGESGVAVDAEEAFFWFEVAHLWVELSDFVDECGGKVDKCLSCNIISLSVFLKPRAIVVLC